MGYITKRGTRWQATYRGPDHRERTRTFDKKVDAERWVNTNAADIARGAWVDPAAGRQSFGAFAASWLSGRPDLRPRSALQYQSLLKCHLLPAFGKTPLAAITPSEVSRWHAALKVSTPGAAPAAYRLLRAILNTAVRDELLVRSPCRVAGAGSDRSLERPMLTVAEVDALQAAMPPNLRAAIAIAAWGALRRGEVLALRRRDIDPLRSSIRVERAQVELSDGTLIFGPPKTDAGVRTVHITEDAMSAVERHLAAYVGIGPDSLLFTGRRGVPLRPKSLMAAFWRARSACGLPRVRFHDLRHFGLTMAAMTNATTKEIMRRAGHSSPSAALRYQHATEDRDRAIAAALSGLRNADVVPISRGQAADTATGA